MSDKLYYQKGNVGLTRASSTWSVAFIGAHQAYVVAHGDPAKLRVAVRFVLNGAALSPEEAKEVEALVRVALGEITHMKKVVKRLNWKARKTLKKASPSTT